VLFMLAELVLGVELLRAGRPRRPRPQQRQHQPNNGWRLPF
jgi:hypothetical protein